MVRAPGPSGVTTEPRKKPTKSVAVLGSGLAGLTTSYLLARSGLDVSLFEVENSLGMDSRSLTVQRTNSTTDEKQIRVDVPMRSFSAGFYTKLLSLYQHLQVPLTTHRYTYNFFDGENRNSFAIFNGGGGLKGFQMQLSWTDTLMVVIGFVYYAILAILFTYSGLTRKKPLRSLSHAQFCQYWCVPKVFKDRFLDPVFMCVCTCSKDDLNDYPASHILEYRAKTILRPHRTTDVSQVVQKLSKPVQHVFTSTTASIDDKSRTLSWENERRTFDYIVYAFPRAHVPTTKTSVITHRSVKSCMPDNAARTLNLGCYPTFTTASHLICREESLVQTTLPTEQADLIPEHLSRADFHRAKAIYNDETSLRDYLNAEGTALSETNGRGGIYQAGSYVYFGIPLLEGCVFSAELVARDILGQEEIDVILLDTIFRR